MTVARFRTTLFFTDEQVLKHLDSRQRRVFGRFGAMVRQDAQRSMRYVTARSLQEKQKAEGTRKRVTSYKPSRPGEPPRAVKPHPWMRKHLEYAWDPIAHSVVVGPRAFGSKPGQTPPLHEYGGTRRIRNPRRRFRQIGAGGEIRIAAADPTAGKRVRILKMRRAKNIKVQELNRVVYAPIRTAAQARRANELNRRLYGPLNLTARYHRRPFVGPAFHKHLPRVRELWKRSV